jgi:hypothetical protein
MHPDAPTPDPPTVSRASRDDGYADASRRADIQAYLTGTENAWDEGFSEWATETSLTEAEYRAVAAIGLFDEFDFYWDATADRVAYTAPELPSNPETMRRLSALDTETSAAAIGEELDELGATVAGVLTAYFVEWETDADIVDTFGSQYNARDDARTDAEARDE